MGDFAYINARVKVMNSRLLPAARLDELFRASDLDAVLQGLADTPYNVELAEALSRFTGVRAVDEGLSQNFSHTTQRILSFADGEARDLIEVVLLRYDLQSLRAIIRGKLTGRSQDEIVGTLFPGGLLSEVKLRELLQQPDVRAIADTLTTWMHPLAGAVREGADALQRGGSLLDVESALDRAYVRYGRRIADTEGDGDLRRYLQAEVTMTNAMTALKLRRIKELPREERERFFVPGGTLPLDRFLTLADPQSSLSEIASMRLFGAELAGTETLSEIERAIEQAFQRMAARMYMADPLGVGVVIGYLARKAAEISNLRVIAHARQLGIPEDVARREIVGV